jgi:hypothetical protein
MSINISKAELDALSDFGEIKDNAPVKLTVLEKILVQYASEFQLELEDNLKERKITASGDLAKSIIPEIFKDGSGFQIRMLNYFDYPNKGVKGVLSSKNALGSPYQYKNFGMSRSGRASIIRYIRDNKSKIKNVRNDVAVGIGLERKGVSAIQSQASTMIYLIKAYGIKKTNYFDDAFNKVFKDFAVTAVQAVGRDIVLTINRLNKS